MKSDDPFLLVSPLKIYSGGGFSLLKSTFALALVLISRFRHCSSRLIARAIGMCHIAHSCRADLCCISLIGLFAPSRDFSARSTTLKCRFTEMLIVWDESRVFLCLGYFTTCVWCVYAKVRLCLNDHLAVDISRFTVVC